MSTKPEVGSVSKLLVSRNEAAAMLSLSPRSVGFLVSACKLPSVRLGRRSLIRMADLVAFSEAGSSAPIRPR